jgi:nucleotide-binding universal stress UspA family protein
VERAAGTNHESLEKAMIELNSLLVPVDFSPVSRSVFEQAVQLVQGDDAAILLLHAIDPSAIDFAEGLGLGSHEAIVNKARENAEREMKAWKASAAGGVDVQTIVSEGVPFIEILRKADDFLVDAIIMGRFGVRGPIEKVLFGTTAERVIRGTSRVVIVVPVET